jgi:transcriptional regulator with XRE-family HTH domain
MGRPRSRSHPQALLPFAVNVRAARAAAGLTQEQLARAANVSLRTVAGWESGEIRLPDDANWYALADALRKDPAWFIQRHEHSDDPVAA